ncbi:MAG: ATPase [Oscillospiraceae bacterium]|jgi:V/A-type H+-transporting ATPase subunit K|nr:ATPase [Oscillospiraceae bacterium]
MKLYEFLLPLLALALICLPLLRALHNARHGKPVKASVLANLGAFFGVCALAVICPAGAFAAEVTSAAAGSAAGMGYLAAALVTGMACIGAGIAVAAGAPAAIGAVSEDPKSFAKALIFVVLGEGVAIYGLLISILILNRV